MPSTTVRAYLVTESRFGRIRGWRHFLDRNEAYSTAHHWRSQSAGWVVVQTVDVEVYQ